MDTVLRELERKALEGDQESQKLYINALKRTVCELTAYELFVLRDNITNELASRRFKIILSGQIFDFWIGIEDFKTIQEYADHLLKSSKRTFEVMHSDWIYYFKEGHPRYKTAYLYKCIPDLSSGNKILITEPEKPQAKTTYIIQRYIDLE